MTECGFHHLSFKIKLNPCVQGGRTRIFGDSKAEIKLDLLDIKKYHDGLQIMTYKAAIR